MSLDWQAVSIFWIRTLETFGRTFGIFGRTLETFGRTFGRTLETFGRNIPNMPRFFSKNLANSSYDHASQKARRNHGNRNGKKNDIPGLLVAKIYPAPRTKIGAIRSKSIFYSYYVSSCVVGSKTTQTQKKADKN
jgi:hypothetical protein